ncbi:MAG: nitrous oxide reductase family maturation protein NosD [Bacteroidetes bacterium]|nr:nitrous oxide reductase family maturation protein NosD [Bacteroidota bacterium]
MKSVINILLFSCFVLPLHAGEITVHPGDNLAAAITLAHAGDTILIRKGVYSGVGIVINKPLSLVGTGWPIIDGEGKGEIFTVMSDRVSFEGLEIAHAGLSYIKENAAIKVRDVRYCTIRNNRFRDNFFAIYVSNSHHSVIEDNLIFATVKRNTSTSGNGIHVWKSDSIRIVRNDITGHRDGIYFEFVREALISDNRSEDNLRYGLHFMFSDHCRYVRNTFRGNSSGVAVMYSKYVEMTENVFENNWGPASYGIMLKDINDSHIRGNRFANNTIGIFAEGCSRSMIERNDFADNGWALKIMANCDDNKIFKNNFIGNSFDVSTNSTFSYNTFENNYWSNYTGYDLDRDGIGDVPYRPVRLFSWITEHQPASLFLLRSFFVTVLDLAEAMIPVLTPAKLMDARPSMRRIL